MRASLIGSRFVAVALAALAANACTQLPTEADVGVGTAAYVPRPAASYAALYKPYAQISALAYADPQFLTTDGRACPDAGKLRDPRLADTTHRIEDNRELADWLDDLQSNWVCVRSHSGVAGCPRGATCVEGLDAVGWRRKDCNELVIAFRGSDAKDRGDWVSNLRWFMHGSTFDQYDQVKAVIGRAVDNAERLCPGARIVTAGHSLGGGLAQQAAFAEARIGYVYAFDSSPVVGLFDVAAKTRMRATEELGIDRVYEAGEVLSLPRFLSSGVFATSQCQPRIRSVRFATLSTGNRRERHSIKGLTKGLVELSRHAAPNAGLPSGFSDAGSCNFASPAFDG